jgi:hypothetical protein
MQKQLLMSSGIYMMVQAGVAQSLSQHNVWLQTAQLGFNP